jgi:signal transduction histidine kinase
MARRLGASLSGAEGFAPSAIRDLRSRVGSTLALGLPLFALGFALIGLLDGLGEPTLTGLTLEPPGGHVVFVDPESYAWSGGIRSGQTVIEQEAGADTGGWAIATEGDGVEHRIARTAAMATARLGLAPALLALVLAFAGIVSARKRHRRAELAGVLGLVLSSIPITAIHDLQVTPIIGALAACAGPVWLVRWSRPRSVWLAVLGTMVLADAAWVPLRLVDASALADLDAIRFQATVVIGLVVAAIGIGVTPNAVARRSSALRYFDVATAASLVIGLALIQLFAAPPIWVLAVIVLCAALAYGGIRGAVARWIDRVVFAEAREHASISAAEAERARLSRELHDDPLQALTGVILALEHQPNTARERDTLRTVASQLRSIATKLHPPVLDDLGLVPAIESLFSSHGPVRVELQVANEAGYEPASRPPFDVELAVYRIVQEAATNAIRHSGCQHIVVRGEVGPVRVSIDIVDDGRGMQEREVDLALREGHLGLASMRRRAEAINARLVHAPGPGSGTVVSLRWPA